MTIPGRSLHVQVAGAGSTQSTPREVRVELWSQESGWIVLADLVAPAPEVPVGPVEDAAHAIRYALMVNAPVLDVLS
ncbi:hypothetical protein [Luteococcus sp.]|uniref:hypothetical protein n=1 Tax=Luteococcus sp. TaxID=1969402 RepID=UPI003735263D